MKWRHEELLGSTNIDPVDYRDGGQASTFAATSLAPVGTVWMFTPWASLLAPSRVRRLRAAW